MNTTAFTEFHKTEYLALRTEIEASVKEARDLERYVLLATAAVWTWLATEGKDVAHTAFYWIPLLIVIAAIARSSALLLSVRKIASYIITLEATFAQKPPIGWETFVKTPRDHSIWLSSALFWGVLLVATSIAPTFMK